MPLQFPFTAVVGSSDLALALVLTTISPEVGGVLVRGEKGTAKSTMVRALATVLPPIDVFAGDRFSIDPDDPGAASPDGPFGPDVDRASRPVRLVELPVGATEDRVLGSLHLERALSDGKAEYEPGLLARAHRGILYVDEVNLLGDHLVDLLLDAAAMGRSTVERDGISVAHAARFVLVGTMNPEEGELRPQLLDRFGLTVQVAAPRDPAVRVEVVRRRMAFDADPAGFVASYADVEAAFTARVQQARELVPKVALPDAALLKIAEVCSAFDVDGMRADLVTARAAIAHAAWDGRTTVTRADIRAAALLALPHRRRRNPFDAPGIDEALLDQVLGDDEPDPDDPLAEEGGTTPSVEEGVQAPATKPGDVPADSVEGFDGFETGRDGPPQPAGDTGRDGPPQPAGDTGRDGPPQPAGDTGRDGPPQPAGPLVEEGAQAPVSKPGDVPGDSSTVAAGAPYRPKLFTVSGLGSGTQGGRSRAITTSGTRIGARAAGAGSIHLIETIQAAAPHQAGRIRTDGRIALRPEDLRVAVREGREANVILFCVDASGSMAARTRMQGVKAAVLSLLLDAYRRRDRVGLVTFRGDSGVLTLPPTSSVEIAAARLEELPGGGRTPLAEGMSTALETLRIEAVRDPDRRPLLVLVTDGRATYGADAVARSRALARQIAGLGLATLVIDCETGRFRLGLAQDLAADLQAQYVPLGEVSAEALAGAVRSRVGGAA